MTTRHYLSIGTLYIAAVLAPAFVAWLHICT